MAAVVSGAVVGGAVATASGPPPPEPVPPALRTVVAHGAGTVVVERPRRKTDASIEAAVVPARRAALPRAVESARADAIRLARAAGVTLGEPIGIERQVSPYNYGDETEGTNGPGRWCWSDRRGRRRCHVPRRITVRVTLTIAAS